MLAQKLVVIASVNIVVLLVIVEASLLNEFIKFKQVEYENLPSEL